MDCNCFILTDFGDPKVTNYYHHNLSACPIQENVEGRTNTDSKSENVAEDEKDEKPVMGVEASKLNADLDIGSKDNKIIKVETEAKGAQGEVNRDLLQAIFLNTVFSCAFILPFLHFIIVMVFLFGNRLSGFLIETE